MVGKIELVPCAFCSGIVDRQIGPRCESCGSYHHQVCWVEFDGCTTYGCPNSSDMRKFGVEDNG
jgi:hypothetical protein